MLAQCLLFTLREIKGDSYMKSLEQCLGARFHKGGAKYEDRRMWELELIPCEFDCLTNQMGITWVWAGDSSRWLEFNRTEEIGMYMLVILKTLGERSRKTVLSHLSHLWTFCLIYLLSLHESSGFCYGVFVHTCVLLCSYSFPARFPILAHFLVPSLC